MHALSMRERNALLIRIVLYILIFVATNAALLHDARFTPNYVEKFTSYQWSYAEIIQNFALLGAALIVFYGRHYYRQLRVGSLVMATFLLASMARQNHIRLAHLGGDSWLWKTIVAIFALFTIYYLYQNWRRFLTEIGFYFSSFSFGLFTAGFLTTYVYSRLFGRSILWQATLGEGYLRNAKNLGEEGTELIGFLLIFFAAIELVILMRRLVRQPWLFT